ncbi:hypothetical protein DIS24_g9902 [Lasiodiplodia hormozganensis]|uniref:Azaphilone pigments biosynthesis cluster protein L N-terminal domain-containing protein n=1 Tax=Lasiodiplodia hormozganensis TaxID=869390 RepID=A0AA40CH85_9PEZI|nr:hypothetical protein DIS24_g9902 [Lasiodiplodia hormozganensis]
MDAISGGASVLAFIGLALKSTESVYKTISGIRDAPEKVQRLSSAVADLQSVLRQLSGLFEPPNAAQSFDEFESAIRKCETDLAFLSKKLSTLQNTAGDRKWKAAWKRIKAILEKEDMQEMWTTVHHHVTVLGVYLGLLQSFSAVRQMQSISALEQAFQTNTDHVISNTQNLGVQASSISSLDGRLQLFESHSSAAQRSTEQALDALGKKIDSMPSLSQNQFDIIKEMLEHLSIQQERKIGGRQSNSSQPSSTVSEVDEDSVCDINSSYTASSTSSANLGTSSSSILPSIMRLCRLVDHKEKTVGSSQAAEIIEDLETLLKTIQDEPPTIAGEKRKRDDEAEIAKSDIKRVKGLLTSAYHIKVNNESKFPSLISLQWLT